MKSTHRTLIMSLFVLAIALIPYFFLTKQLFLRDPVIWPDESIFVDSAKTLNATGTLATRIFGDTIPGLTIRANWYPPLYFYLLAAWIRIFGSSIESVRALSVGLSGAAILLMFLLINKLIHNSWLAVLGTFALTIDPAFGQAARVARMDMLSISILLLTYNIFLTALATRNRRDMIAAGVCCGIAILTHPLGLLAPAITGLTILLKPYPIRQKISDLASLAVPTLIAAALWFISMGNTIPLFFSEYALQFARKAAIIPYPVQLFTTSVVWQLLYILYAILLVNVTAQAITDRTNDKKRFIALGLWISTFVLLWGKENWYNLYFQPFITLSALLLLSTKSVKIYSKVFFSSVLIGIIFVYIFVNHVILTTYGQTSFRYHAFTAAIAPYIPNKSTVFLAVIPDLYMDYQNKKSLTIYEFPTVPVDPAKYRALLDSVDIVVTNFTPDPILAEYLQGRAKLVTEVRQPDGYEAMIFKLPHAPKSP